MIYEIPIRHTKFSICYQVGSLAHASPSPIINILPFLCHYKNFLVHIFMAIIGRKTVDGDRGKEIKGSDRNSID